MNDSIHESLLGDGECPLLKNLLPRGRDWVSRRGITSVQPTAAVVRLLSGWALKWDSPFSPPLETEPGAPIPQYVLFAGSNGRIRKGVGSGYAIVPENGVALVASTGQDANRPWWAVSRGLQSYVCRQGQKDSIPNRGRVFHVSASQVSKAGISKPPIAPVVVEGTLGLLDAGTYKCGFTYVLGNGNESDMSTVAEVTITQDKRIDWSNILPSGHPRCTIRRLYKSVNGGEILFQIAELANGVDHDLFVDNVREEDYGDEAILGLTYPPLDPYMLTAWQDRLWVSDGELAWQSDPVHWEEFDPLKAIRVRIATNDISRLKSLVPWDNNRMAFLKEHSVHTLNVDPGSLFGYRVEHISTVIGCAGAGAACIGEGTLFWYSGLQVWASEGGNPVCISDKKVERVLSQVQVGRREHAWMVYDERTGFIILSLSVGSTAENNMALGFNVRTGMWTTLRWNENDDASLGYGPTWMGRVQVDNQDQEEIMCTFDNMNRLMFLNGSTKGDVEDNNGHAVRCEFMSPCIQAEGNAIGVRRVRILVSRQREDGDITGDPDFDFPTYGDFDLRLNNLAYSPNRTGIRLDNEQSEWTSINLDNLNELGNTVLLHGVIRAKKAIAVHGIVFETTIFTGRTEIAV